MSGHVPEGERPVSETADCDCPRGYDCPACTTRRPAPAGDGPRTDTADVTRLAEALLGAIPGDPYLRAYDRAAALLPVVASLAREQAAEELEAAARRITNTVDPAGDGFTVRATCVSLLRDIAALRSQR